MRLIKTKRMVISLVAVGLVGATAGFIIWQTTKMDVPPALKGATIFTVYYPASLPNGYQLDEKSISVKNGLVAYSLVNDKRQRLNVVEQPEPQGFDFKSFHTKQLSGGRTIKLSIGTAVFGKYNDRLVASIRADKTWIIISSVEQVSVKDLESLSQELKAVSD